MVEHDIKTQASRRERDRAVRWMMVFGAASMTAALVCVVIAFVAPRAGEPALILFLPAALPFWRACRHVNNVVKLEKEQRIRYHIRNNNPLIEFMNVHPYGFTAVVSVIALGIGIQAVASGWEK